MEKKNLMFVLFCWHFNFYTKSTRAKGMRPYCLRGFKAPEVSFLYHPKYERKNCLSNFLQYFWVLAPFQLHKACFKSLSVTHLKLNRFRNRFHICLATEKWRKRWLTVSISASHTTPVREWRPSSLKIWARKGSFTAIHPKLATVANTLVSLNHLPSPVHYWGRSLNFVGWLGCKDALVIFVHLSEKFSFTYPVILLWSQPNSWSKHPTPSVSNSF